MSTKKKVVNYVDRVLAYLQGDEDKTIALKNARKAQAAVKGQISALQSRLVDEEEVLQTAIEKEEEAKYPKTLIAAGAEASRKYVDSILNTSDAVIEAEESIEITKETIALLEAFLEEHKF